jgi:hypothetical protein
MVTNIRDAITTLNDLHQRLGLVQTRNPDFFSEWVDKGRSLTHQEQASIDRIKQRYDFTVYIENDRHINHCSNPMKTREVNHFLKLSDFWEMLLHYG